MPTTATAACPLCDAHVDRELHRRWRKDGFDIVSCPTCSLTYRFDLPTNAELSAIYGEGYFRADAGDTHGQGYHDYLGDEQLHRLNARRRIAALRSIQPQPGRLLDIGSAAGFFVDEAGRAGWDAHGIDVASSMVRFATEKLSVPVTQTSLAQSAFDEGSFHSVTMWDYIEHAIEPIADLAHAALLLEPGGILGLSTGDIGSVAARVSASRWHLLTPRHHNFFFSVATLRRALDKAGFEIIDVRHPGAAYPASYLIYKLQTLASLELLNRAASGVRGSRIDVGIRLNLGDIMTVWAQRR